ncbi:MAG: peptidyl-prolyl cis-trans isomerase [Deltaproteobacteria bacterium]|nr:peptidyl-prolyl cis-trans isomerase [Deltaproteobacteria bacterium]
MRLAPLLVLAALGLGVACNEKAVQKAPDAAAAPGGLTPEQAQKPLAKVGDKVITLGDFAQALADMPEYERLRYQGIERRKELLRAMIDMHLLADEAKKQGLDKDPLVSEEVRQILVAWMRGKLLEGLPTPAQLPEAELRTFYDAHVGEYREPERRRVAQIVVKDEATAKKVFDETKGITPTQWGALVKKYSDDKPGPTEAPETAGDVGFLTAPSDTHAQPSPKATAEVRTAAFALPSVGAISPPFKDVNGWHVIRLVAKNEARDQSFADVERSIRVRVLQEKRAALEKALLEEMKKTVKVEIDEATLAAIANELALPPAVSGSATAVPLPTASAAPVPSASAAPSASGPKK